MAEKIALGKIELRRNEDWAMVGPHHSVVASIVHTTWFSQTTSGASTSRNIEKGAVQAATPPGAGQKGNCVLTVCSTRWFYTWLKVHKHDILNLL